MRKNETTERQGKRGREADGPEQTARTRETKNSVMFQECNDKFGESHAARSEAQ